MIRTDAGLILVSMALAAAGNFTGCSSERPPTTPLAETVRRFSVLTVGPSTVPDLLEAVGTVRASQSADLASQMMGNIAEIRVHEGDRVQRGQVLAVIEDVEPRAAVDRAVAAGMAAQQQLAVAESDLALAQSTLKRYQTLYERQSVSPQEFDEVKARQQSALARRDMALADDAQAKAALTQARTSLDYSRIRAPFYGVVAAKKANAGALASPGLPILTLEDVRHYRLETSINERDLQYLRMGQQVPVAIDALGDSELRGKVAQIVPAADPASRSFLIKIDLPADPRLRSGLFGHAQFSRGERKSLLVPKTAIVERGQLHGIFLLDENKVASLRYVTLGKSSGGNVEVLAGLQPGEHLVAKPGEFDLNGKRVEGQ